MPITSFRALFLARSATTRVEEQGLSIKVEKQPADVLLSKIPWGIGIITFSWLGKTLIRVDWSDGLS